MPDATQSVLQIQSKDEDVEGVKASLAAYLHQLGIAQSGAHKDHTVVQVGQTLSDG